MHYGDETKENVDLRVIKTSTQRTSTPDWSSPTKFSSSTEDVNKAD